MDHASRMDLAQRVTGYLLGRHPEILALAVHGSTAKGEDREHSDLEMFAVTREKSDTQAYQLIHEGIVVEVGFVSQEDALREAANLRWDWPVSADGWIHTLAMHDPEQILPRLALLAMNPDPEALARSTRGALTSMYEDLGKIRNFIASGEEPLARLMCHGIALYGVARFLAFANRQYFNGIRNLLTKPRDFPVLPRHFWEDYPRLLAVDGDTHDLAERAERIYGECREILAGRGLAIPDDLALEEKLERGRFPRPR